MVLIFSKIKFCRLHVYLQAFQPSFQFDSLIQKKLMAVYDFLLLRRKHVNISDSSKFFIQEYFHVSSTEGYFVWSLQV